MGRLEGKVAIVTGAGSRGPGVGKGREIAILFAREGARVLLVDRDAEAAAHTQEMIAARPPAEARLTAAASLCARATLARRSVRADLRSFSKRRI